MDRSEGAPQHRAGGGSGSAGSESPSPQTTPDRASRGGTTGTARWLADYTFTQTGRKVHNDVRGRFRFADGLIAEHDDRFGFHAWAREALGPPGLLLGWTPIIQGPVRRRARAGLDEFSRSRRGLRL